MSDPEPASTSADRGPSLVERTSELVRLTGAIEAATRGAAQPVVVRGIAGIGKSALLDAVSASAAEAGFAVLRARADPLEEPFSFGVVLQLLEPALAHIPADAREAIYAGPGGLARPLLESHGAAVDDEAALFPTLHGLFALVTELAHRSPVAIVVDDAQWCDLPSLRFLHYVSRRMAGHRLALVVGTRPVRASQGARILDGLTREVIEPAPLTQQGLGRLLSNEGPGLAAEEVERWHRLTAGVPHHAMELLRAGDGLDDAALHDDLTHETVRRRLAGLSEGARRLVEAAAVCGDGSPWWRVAQVAGIDDATEVLRREMVDAHLLQPGPDLRFVHAEVRDAVGRGIGPARAEALHRAAAEALLESSAPVELVAQHLLRTAPVGSDRHAEVLWQASRRSGAAGTRRQATAWLHRALEEGPGPDLHAKLVADLAVRAAEVGDPAWHDALDRFEATGPDPDAEAVTRLRLGRALTDRGLLADGTAVLQRALARRAAPAGDELRLSLLGALAVASRMNVDHRLDLSAEVQAALRSADADSSPAARALLAHVAYDRACSGGTAEEVRSLARRSALNPNLVDGELFGSGTYYLAQLTMVFADDADGIERTAQRGTRVAEQRGHEPLLGLMANNLGKLRYLQGQIDEAVDHLALAVDALRRTRGVVLAGAAGNLALCHLERDDPDAAAKALELPGGPDAWSASANLNNWYFARAKLRLQTGAPGAVEDLRTVLARLDAQGVHNPATIPAAFVLAEVLQPIDPEAAGQLLARAHQQAEAFGATRTLAIAARARAVVDADRSLEHLREAESLVAASPWGLERLHARLELGRELARSGDVDGAQAVLRQVLADADGWGARWVAGRARRLLHSTGARPRRTALTGPAALTATEHQVALLAREGLTNRQIATRRFVSVKAVEYHLANAYRKLGIKNRAQLVIALPPSADEPAGSSPRR